MTGRSGPGLRRRATLACHVWRIAAGVVIRLRREPLPQVVSRYSAGDRGGQPLPPWFLARAVDRALRIGGSRPRCLINALVLYRLLREQGDPAELVIGLPQAATDHRAHAWVELEGRDVGPPPGRAGHQPLARYGG